MSSSEGAPGQGRYAHLEHEQRWLLRSPPPGLHDPAVIVDRYLVGTTLRLRHVTDERGGTIHKLGQKVRSHPGSPELVHLTTLYLRPDEHELLATLPAREVRKTRWHLDEDGRRFSVDVFEGGLGGLILAELELAPGEARIAAPAWAAVEVTDDDRYTGGSLAAAGSEALPEPG